MCPSDDDVNTVSLISWRCIIIMRWLETPCPSTPPTQEQDPLTALYTKHGANAVTLHVVRYLKLAWCVSAHQHLNPLINFTLASVLQNNVLQRFCNNFCIGTCINVFWSVPCHVLMAHCLVTFIIFSQNTTHPVIFVSACNNQAPACVM